ncbi:MAG: mechanosensitive ion channel family protein [Pseudomonadota bacterium]
MPSTTQEEARPVLPERLSADLIDGVLATLTDAEIRHLLREELARQAAEREVATADAMPTFEQISGRLAEMATRIRERAGRWAVSLSNIAERGPRIATQLEKARAGIIAMLIAALAVLLAGIAAASGLSAVTRRWRNWLATPAEASYWDRVLRTIFLGLLALLPIAGFVMATKALVSLLAGVLGPLADYAWIYEAGVSYSWAFIVVTRRAFAPDAPAIRIAPIDDQLAAKLHGLLRTAVRLGAAAWLVAGLMFHLGLGFPPIMVLRGLAGTLIAGLLLWGLWKSTAEIRAATRKVFSVDAQEGTVGRIAEAAAPALLALYILAAWAYWLAHWLETGQDRLVGPAGTLLVYLLLPIVDRMGREGIASMIRRRTPMAQRFRRVFNAAWRTVIGGAALIIVAALWGLDLVALTIGPNAPGWARTASDVVVTLLLGWLIWRLIGAALYAEKRISDAAEDADPSSVPAVSRLDTLVPLLRNTLLAILGVAVTMIILSALGIDIAPLIASAGIVGIAVGFGAQSLVRDIFSGVFFLFDDAFRVGEYIELDPETRGEVEAISVRSMQLRHHRGAVITIPYGELKQIMNHNRDWVIYKMSFRMEPDTDPQRFKKLVKEVAKEFLEHPEHGSKFLEPLKSQGVYYVDDDSALVMRVKFKCRPRAQFVLRREIYHRLRQVFAQNDMQLSRRKVEVVAGDATGLAAQAAAESTLPPNAAASV